MKIQLNGNNRSLETSGLFPYVAWTVMVGFALFVYKITLDLQDVVSNLQTQTQQLQERINTDPKEIKDFNINSV